MTKVLVLTNKNDITSDFVVKILRQEKIPFYRFNTEEITQSLELTIDFTSNSFVVYDSNLNKAFDLKSFSSVYYRRPELPEISNKGLTTGEIKFIRNEIIFSLEGLYKLLRDAYWVSPLYSIREAENKIYQLDLAKSIGFNIPDSIISNSISKINEFFQVNKKHCIIKPIKSGLIEDKPDSKIVFTSKLKELPEQSEKIKMTPNFLQTEIKKKGDIRVIIVGNKIFATFINSQINESTRTDWRKGETQLKHIKTELPRKIQEQCFLLLQKLNLRYAAIDLILDDNGKYIFLEINPNGQWAWIENRTGYPISNEIVKLLKFENI